MLSLLSLFENLSHAQVAMVWEGKEVIKTGRGMIGATSPLASGPGTIRGDFGIDVGRNIIHGSGESFIARLKPYFVVKCLED